jgi:hypothetical protein
MNAQLNAVMPTVRHPGPPLGVVATIFTILFLAGLYPVTMFGGAPYFPGPWESASTIVSFFQLRSTAVLLCSFFHFGAAIALGIFTATVVSQLRFLGARVAGTYIALFGGLATAFNMGASASVLWVMACPGIAQDATVVQALYYLQYMGRRPGLLGAARTIDSRCVHPRGSHEALAEMAGGLWYSARNLRRAELVEPGLSEDSLPHSPYEVSRLCLAHCNWIPAAKEDCL